MAVKSQLPTRVVRFFGSTDYAHDALAHREATFVHVSKLNDPFDPYFALATDFGEDYSALLAHVEKRHPEDASWFRLAVTEDNWLSSVRDIREHMKTLSASTYVFSTNAVTKGLHPKDSLYMWGHYANGHRGVAIEFDPAEIARDLIAIHERETGQKLPLETVFAQVVYRHEVPRISREDFFRFFRDAKNGVPDEQTKLSKMYDVLNRLKSNVWEPENEYRLLWQNDTTKLKIHRVPISDKAVAALYVGIRTPQNVVDDLVFEMKRQFPSAQAFKAKQRAGSFALDFELLP